MGRSLLGTVWDVLKDTHMSHWVLGSGCNTRGSQIIIVQVASILLRLRDTTNLLWSFSIYGKI